MSEISDILIRGRTHILAVREPQLTEPRLKCGYARMVSSAPNHHLDDVVDGVVAHVEAAGAPDGPVVGQIATTESA